MAIEKMSLVTIAGLVNKLDDVLLKCCQIDCFHIEYGAYNKTYGSIVFDSLKEMNPYTNMLKKVYNMAEGIGIDLKYNKGNEIQLNLSETEEYLRKLYNESNELSEANRLLATHAEQCEQSLKRVKHLHGLSVDVSEIFSSKYVKVRFGRLPTDSLEKLSYYSSKTFFFFPFDENEGYTWGIYFTPAIDVAEIDDIFNSLYFERIRIPDFVSGTADEAISHLNSEIEEIKANQIEVKKRLEEIKITEEAKIQKIYSQLKFHDYIFDIRKNISVINDKFYLIGYVPIKKVKEFLAIIDRIDGVAAIEKPNDIDERLSPPILLKNNRLFKPFEIFVKMYGLPNYKDIDPTPLVAIIYTLLFGIMFGDLGQGILISVIGFILSKWKKMEFGKILTRIGMSSAVFGLAYGSVFGYEHALDGFYKFLGFKSKPIEVFEMSQQLLIAALGIGAVIIVVSMILNIMLKIKQKNVEEACFGSNGIAGLLLYVAVLGGAAVTLLLGATVFTPIYVIFLILLPIGLMFFKAPLSQRITRKKSHHEKQTIGNFIIENFIEMFETLLSYITNTMSFLRVGGFILSHAGMMLVVFALANAVPGFLYPIVMILGNLFVIGVEGLLVGIQVLRLQFYELFSRFYKTTDKEFKPIGKIN